MKQLFQKVRQLGVLYVLGILFCRIVPEWICRFRCFDLYELNPDWRLQESAQEFSVSCYTKPSDRERAKQLTRNPLSELVTQRHLSLVAEFRGQPVGGVWAAAERFLEQDLGVVFRLDRQQLWCYCAYVNSEFRGQGVYKCLLNYLFEHLSDLGYEQVWVAANPANRMSRYAHRRHCRRRVARFWALRILKTTVCLSVGDVRPGRYFSWNSENQPIQIDLP